MIVVEFVLAGEYNACAIFAVVTFLHILIDAKIVLYILDFYCMVNNNL